MSIAFDWIASPDFISARRKQFGGSKGEKLRPETLPHRVTLSGGHQEAGGHLRITAEWSNL
jgi:hypothetical protein